MGNNFSSQTHKEQTLVSSHYLHSLDGYNDTVPSQAMLPG